MQYDVKTPTYAVRPPSDYHSPILANARGLYNQGADTMTHYREAHHEQAALRKQTMLRLSSSYLQLEPPHHHDVHGTFLDPSRPTTTFVNTITSVKELIAKTFKKITGEEFPATLHIIVCTKKQLKHHYKGEWREGIQGFSINKQGHGTNEVFILENCLDQLMLVTGHEIGHVMTPTVDDPRDEEAKAFAFEHLWIDTIIEHNIGGLSNAYHHEPAKNGVHDVAFSFVRHLLSQGKEALKIFQDLALGKITVNKTLQFLAR